MKKLLFAFCTLVLACSCINIHYNGNGKRIVCKGPVEEKSLDLTGFNAINVNGSSDMIITQSESFSVKVKANEEAFEYLDYEVEDGVLIIKTKDNVQIVAQTYEVYVTLPCLENLVVNGAADADIHDYSSAKDLTVLVNGAGDFEISSVKVPSLSFTVNGAGDIDATELDVESIAVRVNGAGDVNLSGKATKADFSVTGAGDIDAYDLEMEDYEVHKTGLASIKLPKKD